MTSTRVSEATTSPPAGKHVAYARFQSALISGRLQSGQFVSQRTLVDMLDLSIGALRELLPRLEAEGLLKVMPQRGIRIMTVDRPMIRDAFQLRVALEREAVLSCVQGMDDEGIAAHRDRHLERLGTWQCEPTEAFLAECQEIDTAFHQALVDATRNALLIRAHAVNAIRIRLIKRERISLSPANFEVAFRDHLRVIDAIAARDARAAVVAMEEHVHRSRQHAMSD